MATGRWPLSAETLTSACEPRMSQMCQLRALKVLDYPDTFRSRMDRGGTRQLLAEAARRAAGYLEALSNRPAGPLPGAAKKLVNALDQPLPDRGSDGADILAFLDDFGLRPRWQARAAGISDLLPAALCLQHWPRIISPVPGIKTALAG